MLFKIINLNKVQQKVTRLCLLPIAFTTQKKKKKPRNFFKKTCFSNFLTSEWIVFYYPFTLVIFQILGTFDHFLLGIQLFAGKSRTTELLKWVVLQFCWPVLISANKAMEGWRKVPLELPITMHESHVRVAELVKRRQLLKPEAGNHWSNLANQNKTYCPRSQSAWTNPTSACL